MEDKTSLVAKKKRKLTLGSQVSKREYSKYINYNSSLLRSTYSCLVETNEELKPPKGLKSDPRTSLLQYHSHRKSSEGSGTTSFKYTCNNQMDKWVILILQNIYEN